MYVSFFQNCKGKRKGEIFHFGIEIFHFGIEKLISSCSFPCALAVFNSVLLAIEKAEKEEAFVVFFLLTIISIKNVHTNLLRNYIKHELTSFFHSYLFTHTPI